MRADLEPEESKEPSVPKERVSSLSPSKSSSDSDSPSGCWGDSPYFLRNDSRRSKTDDDDEDPEIAPEAGTGCCLPSSERLEMKGSARLSREPLRELEVAVEVFVWAPTASSKLPICEEDVPEEESSKSSSSSMYSSSSSSGLLDCMPLIHCSKSALAPDVLCAVAVAASAGAVLDDPPTSFFWDDEKTPCADLRSIFFSGAGPGVVIAEPRAEDGAELGAVEEAVDDETEARDGRKGGMEAPSGVPVTDFLFIFLLFSIFSLSSRLWMEANVANDELEIDVGMPTPSSGGEERGEEAAEDEAEDEDDTDPDAADGGSVPVLEDTFFFFLRPGRRGRLSPISEARLRELRERDVVCFVNSSAMLLLLLLRCSLPSSSADKEEEEGKDEEEEEEEGSGLSFDPDEAFDIVATWTVSSLFFACSLGRRDSCAFLVRVVRRCGLGQEIAWRSADGRTGGAVWRGCFWRLVRV